MKKKNNRKIGKPELLLYKGAYAYLKPKYTKKYGLSMDKDIVPQIKGPAIVVAAHTSDKDHFLAGLTLYPIRPTFVVSEHFVHMKSTKNLLKHMHVITKRMFCADAKTIVNIMRAKREGNIIVIFPEGRLTWFGHSLKITDGTAELIKKFGTDVYVYKADGAYLTFPKWREAGTSRRGQIHTSIKRLMTEKEVADISVDDLKEILASALLHDDEKAMDGIFYKSDDMTKGLDRILYRCPACKNEFTLTAGNGKISCICGFSATLDGYYKLHGAPYRTINEWVFDQASQLDTEISLSSEVRIGSPGDDGIINEFAGKGFAYLDKTIFTLEGSVFGERISLSLEPAKIGAFPITAGEHFDVYYHNRLLYIYPIPSGNAAVKWVMFLDKVNSQQ